MKNYNASNVASGATDRSVSIDPTFYLFIYPTLILRIEISNFEFSRSNLQSIARQAKFLVLAIDDFTQAIKVEPNIDTLRAEAAEILKNTKPQ